MDLRHSAGSRVALGGHTDPLRGSVRAVQPSGLLGHVRAVFRVGSAFDNAPNRPPTGLRHRTGKFLRRGSASLSRLGMATRRTRLAQFQELEWQPSLGFTASSGLTRTVSPGYVMSDTTTACGGVIGPADDLIDRRASPCPASYSSHLARRKGDFER